MDTNQKTRAVELVELINSLGHECALIGGIAVSVRTRPRMTKDVDVAVAVATDRDAESVVFGLSSAGYSLRNLFESELNGHITTARFNHPGDSTNADEPTIDALFESSGIEREVVAGATPLAALDSATVRVARVPHLIALKTLSESDKRPNDRDDLRALIRVASKAELREAAELVTLIQDRGYNRGKDLPTLLRMFIQRNRARGHAR